MASIRSGTGPALQTGPAPFNQSREGARGRLILGLLHAAAAFNRLWIRPGRGPALHHYLTVLLYLAGEPDVVKVVHPGERPAVKSKLERRAPKRFKDLREPSHYAGRAPAARPPACGSCCLSAYKGGRLVDRDFTPKAIREKITEENPSWWPKK
jgi:hypothetical protein